MARLTPRGSPGQTGDIRAMDPFPPYANILYRLPVTYVESRVYVMPCLAWLTKKLFHWVISCKTISVDRRALSEVMVSRACRVAIGPVGPRFRSTRPS